MKRKRRQQNIIGVLSIIIGILTPIVCDGDATASIIMLPLGIYALVTKEIIIN